jgi:acetylornithine deacetylase
MGMAMRVSLPKLFELFAQLVAIPSVSSVDPRFNQSNRAVIELLAEWLAALGFEIELTTISKAPDKLNLIARLGKGVEGLVLSGHTDTVPFDEGAWTTDPFVLTEKEGRLYGLGTADMKGFFPLIIEAIRGLELSALKRPLIILATADEESTMAGARRLAQSAKPLGHYALIGEPTGLKPVHMHKGVLMGSIRLQGRAGHASDPRLGNNAIDGMYQVIGALLNWREELRTRYRNPLFEVMEPTLNLGSIHGGDSPNRICAHCQLQVDIRLLPGMPLEEIQATLKAKVEQAIAGTGLTVQVSPIFNGVPAFATGKDSWIVRMTEQLSGQDAGTVAFATEGPFLNTLGMETVILGPGDIAQAHQADEFLAVERLQPMVELLRKLIVSFCTASC